MAHLRTAAFLILLLCSHTPAEAAWKAGAAKINITPDEYILMAGYGGRDDPASGKVTDLWAKALVLEDAQGERGVVITLDLVGIDRSLSLAVCKSLLKSTTCSVGRFRFAHRTRTQDRPWG